MPYSATKPLRDQVALVTGAGRRIGREIALALARAGASVVVNYNQSRRGAEATAQEIEALGSQSLAIQADVSNPGEVQAMFRAASKRFHRLDILVNNAGIFFRVPIGQLTEKDWDRVLGTNLKGTFFCAQAAARIMLRRKAGRIINLSSLGGLEAWPGYMHYCASKAAVVMLTKCLAKALAPHILVNSVAPGTILFPEERRSSRMQMVTRVAPLRKPGEAADITEAVLYLAAQANYMTGQVLVVDGGQSIP